MNPPSAGNIFSSPVKSGFVLSEQVGVPHQHQCSAPEEDRTVNSLPPRLDGVAVPNPPGWQEPGKRLPQRWLRLAAPSPSPRCAHSSHLSPNPARLEGRWKGLGEPPHRHTPYPPHTPKIEPMKLLLILRDVYSEIILQA